MRTTLIACLGGAAVACGTQSFAQEAGSLNEVATRCRPLITAQPSAPERRPRSSAQTWSDANGAARQRPERAGFDAARYVYTYAPGAIFELLANPNFISTILLEEGETLTNVAAGDTSRWQVSEAYAEGLTGVRTILLVKPAAIGLRTNIVLVTDRRIYLVEAISQASEGYSAEIAWCYPDAAIEIADTQVRALNFDYRVRVVRGARPVWTPVRVFDDGRRTWIEFPEATEANELPPLFVITREGAELVNYRVDGRRYLVDRVFDRAELRLGVRAPQIVRIERAELISSQRPSRRGRP
ncbi:MAG: TrbG/VirB9 family P-type conjugative transfer protein [Hyphomonadaceae bacterium]|nr:TrbG/VirB9 family P-type conjugative transfer protein [Hyphomonadaceae bacterium]